MVPSIFASPPNLSPTSLPPPAQGRRRSSTFNRSAPPAPGYTPRKAPAAPLSGSRSDWRSKLRRPHPYLEQQQGNYSTSISNSESGVPEKKRGVNGILGSGLGWKNVFGIKGFLLITILNLSFVALILGLVYAGNVTSRLDNGLKQVVIPSTSQNGIEQVYTINKLAVRDVSFEVDSRDVSADHKLTVRDISGQLGARHHDDHDDDNDDDNNNDSTGTVSRTSSKSSALATLFFYVATVPAVSMTHASILLLVLFLLSASAQSNRESSEKAIYSSDSDSETSISNTRETRIEMLRPFVPLLSVISTGFIISAWVTINAIQTQCELTTTSSDVCPILIPWSSAGGIPGLSAARIGISWLAVILYLVFVLVVIKDSQLLGRPTSPRVISISRPQVSHVPHAISYNPGAPRPRRSSMKSRTPTRDPSLPPKTVRFSLDDEEDEKKKLDNDEKIPPMPALPHETVRRSMDVGLAVTRPSDPPPVYTPSSSVDSTVSALDLASQTTTEAALSSKAAAATSELDTCEAASEISSTTDSPSFGQDIKRLTVNEASLRLSSVANATSPTESVINSYGIEFDVTPKRKEEKPNIGTMAIRNEMRRSQSY